MDKDKIKKVLTSYLQLIDLTEYVDLEQKKEDKAIAEECIKQIDEIEDVDYKSKYLYAAAELENFKKISEKHKLNLVDATKKSILIKVLSVLDDLLNIKTHLKSKMNKVVLEALELVVNKILKLLNEKNCKKINCTVGQEFDPHIQTAIAVTSTSNKEDIDKISDVLLDGWSIDNTVLRSPVVKVYKEEEIS